MEKVKKTRRKITITKRNVPIAQLGPIEEKEEKAFGKLKDSIHIIKNIIDPIDEAWNFKEIGTMELVSKSLR